jgi:hypothetical protein
LPADGPGRLFVMGLVTDLLNPKIAFMYVTLLPQFISPDHGSVLVQSLALGPHPDGRQRGGQCGDRHYGGIHCGVPRGAADMGRGPALDHDNCSVRTGRVSGD